jgi:hypothetical protein
MRPGWPHPMIVRGRCATPTSTDRGTSTPAEIKTRHIVWRLWTRCGNTGKLPAAREGVARRQGGISTDILAPNLFHRRIRFSGPSWPDHLGERAQGATTGTRRLV